MCRRAHAVQVGHRVAFVGSTSLHAILYACICTYLCMLCVQDVLKTRAGRAHSKDISTAPRLPSQGTCTCTCSYTCVCECRYTFSYICLIRCLCTRMCAGQRSLLWVHASVGVRHATTLPLYARTSSYHSITTCLCQSQASKDNVSGRAWAPFITHSECADGESREQN